ncbi:TonB-dependent receptor [Tenacibaculum sp. 190130A14a]|uniref:TonB-dependent receptor n=1 Tax=Tenacibaculum polynesiense TaxID=3137857 RepID=A0ABM9PCJ0_9FLAO
MKKLLLAMLLVSMVFCASAQKVQVFGQVKDFKNKSPLSYVTITCATLDGKIITGTTTTNQGTFKLFKLPKAKLSLSFQFIGYKKTQKNIDLTKSKSPIDLGTFLLQENAEHLSEVEIQSKVVSVAQKIDKRVYNIDKNLLAVGSNSLEILETIPSVDVNQLSGTVSLRGNENVQLLVNGKPSNLKTEQLLKQIPSNTIKQIEIITNPSAKYTSEGMSGIINVILKKNTKIGFNGNIVIGIKHSKNTRPDIILNANYKVGRINFYSSYNTSWGDYETFNNIERTTTNLLQDIDFLNNSNLHSFKFGADIELSKQSLLSLYTNQNFDNNSLSTHTKTTQNTTILFDNRRFSTYKQKDASYNIDYVYNFDDTGQNLELELNYSINKNPEHTVNSEITNPTTKEYNYTNDIEDTKKLWLFNIDYTKPIESGSIEFGLEYRKQNFYNRIITDQEAPSTNTSNIQPIGNTSLNYDRDIYSGYISYTQEFNQLAIQIGLRAEQFKLDALFLNTQQGTSSITDQIFSLYPSASINYHISSKDELQLAYSRRVDRPSAYQLTPIQEWASPLTIAKGNINITPQFTNSIELNYTKTINKGYLSIGTFYRRTNDKIGRILQRDMANSELLISSFTNYDFADSYGFEISGSYKLQKWWTIRPSFETYIQDSQGVLNSHFEMIKNTIIKGRISNSFKVSKKLSFQLSTIHRGKSQNVQYTIQPYTMVNIAGKLKILNGKGNITLRGTDIFNNVNFDYSSTNPFQQKGKYILEYDSIFLGFSYNFGSGKNKRKSRKYRDSNESQGGMF